MYLLNHSHSTKQVSVPVTKLAIIPRIKVSKNPITGYHMKERRWGYSSLGGGGRLRIRECERSPWSNICTYFIFVVYVLKYCSDTVLIIMDLVVVVMMMMIMMMIEISNC